MSRRYTDIQKIQLMGSHFGENVLNHIEPSSFMDDEGKQYLSDRAIRFVNKMGGILEVCRLIEKRGI